jgi:ketosteroid isomerase-like protein
VTKDANSTRRSFLKSSAFLAAPLAAAVPAAVIADGGLNARLAKLENEAAIRELHQAWLRRINTGAGDATASLYADPKAAAFDQTVRGIAADHSGQPDAIELAADGKSAAGRFHCAVETETAIAQDCTLARMAHAQGGGFVRRTERRVLHVEYVKSSGAWAIAKVAFRDGVQSECSIS